LIAGHVELLFAWLLCGVIQSGKLTIEPRDLALKIADAALGHLERQAIGSRQASPVTLFVEDKLPDIPAVKQDVEPRLDLRHGAIESRWRQFNCILHAGPMFLK
jgi:hypothetical protein